MNAAPQFLTPSELVYLNGEKFAPKAGVFNSTHLFHLDLKVSALPLAQAAAAAAFLILEQQGSLRLEIAQKKALFGLLSGKTLYANPAGPFAAWPEGTLEAALARLTDPRLAKDKKMAEVEYLVYAWFTEDVANPAEELFNFIKAGLAKRGLVEAQQKTTLKIFKSTVFVLPDSTRQLALAQPLQPVQQALAGCQQARPEVYKMLFDSIKKGLASRQEKSDTDTGSSD